MNDLEIINESEDKKRLIFKDYEPNGKEKIGNKLQDFEILMKLGSGTFGKVYKVRSKLNNKIYALKAVDLNRIKQNGIINQKELQKILKETKIITLVSNPHVIKYYTNFMDNDFLYIINEYVPNGDLFSLIIMKKRLKKKFEEEELWNIFLQCSYALYYIHEIGLIHRDIKPSNIFIDDNLKIKLGDFGCAALEPNKAIKGEIKYSNNSFCMDEEEKDGLLCHFTQVGTHAYMAQEVRERNKYDQKIDVFSLGVTFYEMVYLHSYLSDKKNDKNVSYPNIDKILYIINELMLVNDCNKRKTSEEVYKNIEIEYLKICRNYSIHSMIMCLSAYTDLNKILINESQKYRKREDKPIIKSYTDFMKFLYNKNDNLNDQTIKFINDFKKVLGLENLKLEGMKEIDLSFLFSFIIFKLHDETKIKIEDINSNYRNGPYLINSKMEEEKNNEIKAQNKFDNLFKKYDSPIIQRFRGLIKYTNKCNKCNNKTYDFSSYFLIDLNLNTLIEKQNIMNINLEEILQMKDIFTKTIYCNNCIEKTEHNCEKEYYSFPNLLVFNFYRGNKIINKIGINIKQNLEIKKKYKLVGLIKSIKEYEKDTYISYYYSSISNNWFRSERNQSIVQIDPPYNDDHKNNDGDIVMLYYISIK